MCQMYIYVVDLQKHRFRFDANFARTVFGYINTPI